MPHFIHLYWSGPHTIERVSALNAATDFGIYQVYGPSPTYGASELLYIGKASDRPFSVRVLEHGWLNGTRDRSQVSVYVGKLHGTQTPDNSQWSSEIDCAERLLIYAHFPPYNSQKWLTGPDAELRDVHVLNWQDHRDLLPEVSGARYTTRFDNVPHHPYSNSAIGTVRAGGERPSDL